MATDSIYKLLDELKQYEVGKYGHDFLQTWDKTEAELRATVLVAQIFKRLREEGVATEFFKSGLAVSWFRDKSTRTRFSFKSAANLLGLSVQDLDEQQSQISHGETTRETANMISFLTEVIGIRDDLYLGEGHAFQKQVATAVEDGFEEGILPQRPSVINLQSDRDHPTQSLADLMHLQQYFGGLEELKGKKIVMSWAYSPSYGKPLSVAQGVIGLMTRFGMRVTLAHSEGYELIPELEKQAVKQAKGSGGSFEIVHDMKKAFKGADVVYPKSWTSYAGMQKRAELWRENDFEGLKQVNIDELAENKKHVDWECTPELMKLTKEGKGLYMHCLPADVSGLSCKQGEVAAEVFERYKVQTFTQAGYKPYVIAAMMFLTRFDNASDALERMVHTNQLRIIQ